MRFLRVYLGIYAALIIGAMVALGAGGVLAHLPPLAVFLVPALAAGLGVLLALVWVWRPKKA
jgi:hypothetical protein